MLHNIGIAHLGYRIAVNTNQNVLDKYANIEKTRAHKTNLMNDIEYLSFNANNECYEQVFYLLTHEATTHYEDIFKFSITSILLGKCFLKFR